MSELTLSFGGQWTFDAVREALGDGLTALGDPPGPWVETSRRPLDDPNGVGRAFEGAWRRGEATLAMRAAHLHGDPRDGHGYVNSIALDAPLARGLPRAPRGAGARREGRGGGGGVGVARAVGRGGGHRGAVGAGGAARWRGSERLSSAPASSAWTQALRVGVYLRACWRARGARSGWRLAARPLRDALARTPPDARLSSGRARPHTT